MAGVTGTPTFAAPEQLLGEPQGPAVDCYAIAALIVFVLTGAPPFGEGDAKSILARQLSRDIDLRDFPPELCEWLERGLAPTPEQRFIDATEMRRAFRRVIASIRRNALPWWRRWLEGGDEGWLER